MLFKLGMLLGGTAPAFALTTFYADPASDCGASCTGTETDPFPELRACVEAAAAATPSECILKKGRYKTGNSTIVLNGVSDVRITGEEDGVVIDGTAPVDATWVKVGDNWRTVAPVEEKPWQLWVGGRHQTLARWPNADPWTDGGYDLHGGHWRYEKEGASFFGHVVDDLDRNPVPHPSLADQPNLEGCPVVLNVGHWDTAHAIITEHDVDSNSFSYNGAATGYEGKTLEPRAGDGLGRYFVEGCVQVLDQEGEWAYDDEGHLVIRTWDGVDPNVVGVFGKINTYALAVGGPAGQVEVSNINFFATTLFFFNAYNSTLAENVFDYPSFSRRALGDTTSPYLLTGAPYDPDLAGIWKLHTLKTLIGAAPTFFGAYRMDDFESQCEKMTSLTRTVGSCTKNVVRDNTFRYTDGVALLLHRTGEDLIENNLFSHIDYSAVGIGFGVSGFADAGTFRRNTLEWFGDSVGFRVGGEAWTVDLNHFSHLGLCQSDGAAVQAGQNTATNTVYSRNWAIDSAKKGFRFDMGEDGVEGFNGTMIRNVGVRTSMGMAVKGADHHVFHNLAFGSVKDHDDIDGGGANDISVLECYPCSATRGFYYTNHATVTRNNAGGYISGGQSEQQKHWLLDHEYYDHNYNEHVERTPIEQYLRDSNHLDFRPRQDSPLVDAGLPIVYNSDGSGYYLGREPVADQPFDGLVPDIGAYEYGASLSKYFIPGRIAVAPTHPIPQDTSTQVLPDLDLMFLGGKSSQVHDVYVGLSEDALVLVGQLVDGDNVFKIGSTGQTLELGQTYFWRVDAVQSDQSVVASPVWSFTVVGGSDGGNSFFDLEFSVDGDASIRTITENSRGIWDGDLRKAIARTTNQGKFVAPVFQFGMMPSSLSTADGILAAQLHRMGCELTPVVGEASLYVRTHDSNTAHAESLTLWSVEDAGWSEATITAENVLDSVWRYDGDGVPEIIGAELGTQTDVAPGAWMEFGLPSGMFGEIDDVLGAPLSFAVIANSPAATSLVTKEGGSPAKLELSFQLESCPNTWSIPTSAPTALPTASPTQAPTANPTVSPTAAPTPSPTNSPTPPPTASPTKCADSATWHKAGRPNKTCAWTAGGTAQHRCKNVLGEDGTTGLESCPRTCGTC